jgi:hypothetical protein
VNDPLRVEVHVGGCLGGDLLAMMGGLAPHVVPRHTMVTVSGDDGRALLGVLHALARVGVEVESVTVRD